MGFWEQPLGTLILNLASAALWDGGTRFFSVANKRVSGDPELRRLHTAIEAHVGITVPTDLLESWLENKEFWLLLAESTRDETARLAALTALRATFAPNVSEHQIAQLVAVVLTEVSVADADLVERLRSAQLDHKLDVLEHSLGYVLEEVLTTFHQLGADLRAGLSETTERLDVLIEATRPNLGVADGFRSAYGQVIDAFRSLHGELLGRQGELDALSSLIDSGGYVVLEGEPWSGKTCLTVHLADSFRAQGADVLQFHVVSGSQDTASDALAALNTQLLDILDEDGGVPIPVRDQARQFEALWAAAVTRAEQSDRRLLLIVDGIDEQHPDHRVAGYLPVVCERPASVLVATRPSPDFNVDVPWHHVLHRVPRSHRFTLSVSPHATVSKREAEDEIDRFLSSEDPRRTDAIGFLAYARGLLSHQELSELLGCNVGRVRVLMRGFARHLRRTSDGQGDDRFEFGHVELARRAQAWFGPNGEDRFTQRLLDWSRAYEQQGWPDTTPWYLVRYFDDFVRQLPKAHHKRLRNLISNERIELLGRNLGHTQPLLRTIDTAIGHLAEEDYETKLRLLVYENECRRQAGNVTPNVVGALAAAGLLNLSLEIANGLLTSKTRSQALAQVCLRFPDDALERAIAIIDEIPDRMQRRWAEAHMTARICEHIEVTQALRLVDLDQTTSHERYPRLLIERVAERDIGEGLTIARRIQTPGRRASALSAVSVITAASGAVRRAIEIAHEIEDEGEHGKALCGIATTIALVGDVDSALKVITQIPNVQRRNAVMCDVARAVATSNSGAGLDIARTVPDPATRSALLAEMARSLAESDLAVEAHDVALRIPYEKKRLTAIVCVASLSGDDNISAAALASISRLPEGKRKYAFLERMAIGPNGSETQHAILDIAASCRDRDATASLLRAVGLAATNSTVTSRVVELARAMLERRGADGVMAITAKAAAGRDVEAAITAANQIRAKSLRDDVLLRIIRTIVKQGRIDLAVELLGLISDDDRRGSAMVSIAAWASERTSVASALDIARAIDNHMKRSEALGSIARRTKDASVAREALEVARATPESSTGSNSRALHHLALALAETSATLSTDLAQRIRDPRVKGQALTDVALALVRRCGTGAEALPISLIENPAHRDSALADIATAIALDDLQYAREMLDQINRPGPHGRAQTAVAMRVAETDIAEALRLVKLIAPDSLRGASFGFVASVVAETDPDQALQIIDLESHGEKIRDECLVLIISALAKHDTERAMALATTLQTPRAHDKAMAEIATAGSKVDGNSALILADSIANSRIRVRVVAGIGSELDDLRIKLKALKIASELLPEQGALALADVVEITRDPRVAKSAAEILERRHYAPVRDESVSRVATVVAKWDLQGALTLARQVSSIQFRASALAAVAIELGPKTAMWLADSWSDGNTLPADR